VTSTTRLSRPNAGKDDKYVANITSTFHWISVAADGPISHFLSLSEKEHSQIYIILISFKGQSVSENSHISERKVIKSSVYLLLKESFSPLS
jgi:hypothetical protein